MYAVEGSAAGIATTIVAVTVFVFASMAYFVRQRDRFQKDSDDLLHAILPDEIAQRVCAAVARLREQELYKLPGVGETIAWTQALLALEGGSLEETLGVALKVREDIDQVREEGVLNDV